MLDNLHNLYIPEDKASDFIWHLLESWGIYAYCKDPSSNSIVDKELSEGVESAVDNELVEGELENTGAVFLNFSRGAFNNAKKTSGCYKLSELLSVKVQERFLSVPICNEDITTALEAGLLVCLTKTSSMNKEETKMSTTIKNTLSATATANKDAAVVAAKVAVGKAGNKVVKDMIKPKLPLVVRGYADGVVGSLIAANLAQIAVRQFMGDNRKAVIVADAMVQAAMLDVLGEFDIEAMMESMLDKIKGGKVEKLLSASDADLGLDD